MPEPIYCPVIQGTDEWHKLRLGVVTASQVSSIITPAQCQLASRKGRNTLRNKLLAEWATSKADDFGGNYWTERGLDLEGEAADAFAFMTDMYPTAMGFVFRDEARMTGCSPDWLVGDEAGTELKCPAAKTHIGYMLDGGVPTAYVPQIQFSLWVTGRTRWYFASYHPQFDMHLETVEPDPKWQDAFSEHVPAFVDELLEAREKLVVLGVSK